MDSLNMNNLANSLPSSAIVKAEQETMDKFKAAAQSLTLLYRSSQRAAKRHFDAGYATALDDLLSVIQHSVSADSDSAASERDTSGALSIGRILDWIEARQETLRLKAREEEEEEEEKEARAKTRSLKVTVGLSRMSDSRDKVLRSTENVPSSPPIPTRRLPTGSAGRCATDQPTHAQSVADRISSPSPTLSIVPISQPSAAQAFSSRPSTRARLRSKHVLAPLNASTANLSSSNSTPGLSSDPSVTSITGTKRRHAAMLLDHSSPSSISISLPPSELRGYSTPHSASNGSPSHQADVSENSASMPLPPPRRRIRTSRVNASPRSENAGVHDTHDHLYGETMMDVEGDVGRERKRVARR